jgi:hypothetical protein
MNKLPGVSGNPCVAIPADLAKYEGVEGLVKELEKREKRESSIPSIRGGESRSRSDAQGENLW